MRAFGGIWIAVALAPGVAGCELLFDLDAPPPGPVYPIEPTDRDGDGVLDIVDNCAGAPNVRQLDEDGDAIGDACDNCVGISNLTQDDSQELPNPPDGIGDACDPRAGEVGDFEVGRYFVEAGGDPADWMTIAGAWTLDADAATATDPERVVSTLRYPVQLSPDAVIEVGVAVTATGMMGTGEHQAAGLWIDVDPQDPHGRLCEVRREPSMPTVLALADATAMGDYTLFETPYPAELEDTDSVLQVRRVSAETGIGYQCFDPAITGEPGNLLQVGGVAPDNGIGYFGLYSTNAAVRFRYAVIYDHE